MPTERQHRLRRFALVGCGAGDSADFVSTVDVNRSGRLCWLFLGDLSPSRLPQL